MTIRPGTRIAGRYEIVGEEGDFPGWRAFYALDHEVEVQCSLWLVRPELAPDEDTRRRFVAGMRRARGLSHPAVRKVHDAGDHDGQCFLTQQILAGEQLSGYAGTGTRIGLSETVRLGRRLAEALAAAHAVGLVHGRLTPGDVVLVSGQPKISGLGVWPLLWLPPGHAAARAGVPYLAPEVQRGVAAGPAADVYALALVLAELALGAVAPMGETAAAMIDRLQRELPAIAPNLAPGLALDPDERPLDAQRLVAALAEAAAALASATPGGEEDAPTTHYLALEDTSGSTPDPDLDDELAEPPVAPPSRGETVSMRPPAPAALRTPVPLPLPPAPSSGPFQVPAAAAAPAAALVAPLPRAATPPSAPSVPTIRSPRAPTHREASEVLPAVTPPLRLRPGFPRWALVASGLAAVAALGALIAALTGGGGSTRAAAAAPDAGPAAPAPAATPAARSLAPCPKDMVLLEDKPSVCVDRHEAPGEGFVPATGVTLAQARAACEKRGKRLCTGAEWERACRGEDGASWPYGSAYVADRCNVRGGAGARLGPAGSHPACVSAAGAFDMSGNAAEWVAEGMTRGGSAGDRDDGRCSRVTKRKDGFAADDVGYRCCAPPGAY